MKAGKVVFSILSNDVTVSGLVAEGSNVNVFPVRMKQRSSYPAIVYNAVSNFPNDSKSSASVFDQVRVQIDVYAETYSEAATLDDAVRAALDRYNSSTPATVAGVIVKGIRYLTTNETMDEPDNIFRISTDYQVIIDIN